jgi:HEPN domain-containing protein
MVKPRLRLPKRLEEAIFDLTPLYLPTKYPDAAFGIPSKVYGREYSSKYVGKVGEIIKWVDRKTSRG